VRRSRAGRRNSGERFRPRGGDLRRAKAWASFSRGRGDIGNYSDELDQAKSAGHRASGVMAEKPGDVSKCARAGPRQARGRWI
jgi:hypothetical protein